MLVLFALLVGSLGLVPAGAATASVARAVTVVKAPTNVTQGDRFDVTVRVTGATQAKTVQLQTQTKDIYGNPQWTPTKTVRVVSTAKHTLKALADQVNAQRYRAVATYRDGKRVASKPFHVTVWSWTDLYAISSYYSTSGIANSSMSQFAMNGDQYLGWYVYLDEGMWERRYTPGRNCKAFRGVFGVTDSSADGSSAQFTLLTDETNVVYTSPTLVPGPVTKAQFNLAKPYRLSIQARNTSPNGELSYPAIGNPQLLCTGL